MATCPLVIPVLCCEAVYRRPAMRSYRSRIDTMPLTVVLVAIFIVDIAALGVVSPVLGQQLPWLPFTWFLIAASLPVVLALTIVPVRYPPRRARCQSAPRPGAVFAKTSSRLPTRQRDSLTADLAPRNGPVSAGSGVAGCRP